MRKWWWLESDLALISKVTISLFAIKERWALSGKLLIFEVEFPQVSYRGEPLTAENP